MLSHISDSSFELVHVYLYINPFTDEAQTALFKDPVRTEQ